MCLSGRSGNQCSGIKFLVNFDVQVTAVVLQLDEGNEANRRVNPKFLKTVKRHEEMPSFPLGSSKSRQSLIPFQVKKNLVQQIKPKMRSQVMAPPAKNYRVVLGLLAPALSKVHLKTLLNLNFVFLGYPCMWLHIHVI